MEIVKTPYWAKFGCLIDERYKYFGWNEVTGEIILTQTFKDLYRCVKRTERLDFKYGEIGHWQLGNAEGPLYIYCRDMNNRLYIEKEGI